MKTGIRYVLSLLLTALMCIFAIALGVYVIYGDYSRNQIEEKQLASFTAAQVYASDQLMLLMQYARQLSDNLPLLLQNGGQGHSSAEEQALVSLLSNLEHNAAIEASITFFLRSDPAGIYTSMGRLSYASFEARLAEININADQSTLFSRLLTVKTPVLFSPSPHGSGKLALALPLGNALSAYPATLLALIDQAVITSCFSSVRGDGGTALYGLDQQGQVLFSLPASQPAMSAQTLWAARNGGVCVQEVDGKRYVFVRTPSSTGLLACVAVISEGDFYSGWYDLSKQLLIVIAIVTLFAVALSLLLGYVIYQPLRRAYTRVTGTRPAGRSTDELETIVSAYERSVENATELEERAEASINIIRRQFMLALINGNIKSSKELEGFNESLMADFFRPWWMSIYLSLLDGAAGRTDSVLAILADYRCPQGEMLFAECRWERGIGIVLNFTSDDLESAPYEMASSILSYLKSRISGPIRLSAGSVESDPLRMGISFYRATATMKAMLTVSEDTIFTYKAEPALEHSTCLDTTLLAEGITYGNAEVAATALTDLVDRLSAMHDHLPLIRLGCGDILNTIIRYAQKQNIPLDMAKLSEAAEFHTIETFIESTRQLISEICEASSHRRSQDSELDRSRIIATIAENYRKNTFSLKALCEQVGMSMSKVNIVLKESLGISFVQYVSLLRVNEVKRLLRETDDSILSIVQSVGYIDVSSFMRKFKQMEGISPGQYRSQHSSKRMV